MIGSREVALEVVRLLRDVVAGAKFSSFQQLVDHLEEVGRLLQEAGPKGDTLLVLSPLSDTDTISQLTELVVTNMTRRICMLIREEYQTALSNHLDDSTGADDNGAGPSSPNYNSDLASPMLSHTAGAAPTPALSRATSSFFPERRDSGDILGRTTDGSLGSIFNLLGHSNATEGASRSALSAFGGLGGGGGTASQLGSPASSAAPSPVQSPESSQILQRPNPFATTASHRDSNFASFDDNASANTPEEDDFSRRSFSLKPVFIEAIAELMDEVETTYRSVGEQAIEHIHSGYDTRRLPRLASR